MTFLFDKALIFYHNKAILNILSMITPCQAGKVRQLIDRAEKICLVVHQKPDFDALGSGLAFIFFLEKLGKRHILFCKTPAFLTDFASHRNIVSRVDDFIYFDPDLIIVLDSSDLMYAGIDEILPHLKNQPFIINIDHHPVNNAFGDLNIIYPEAASTTEIVFNFLKLEAPEISKQAAEFLLLGLLDDTQTFSNPATSARSLKMASELLLKGVSFTYLRGLFKNRTIAAWRLFGEVLRGLGKNEKLDMVFTIIREEDLRRQNLSFDDLEGVTNFLNYLNEGKVALMIKATSEGTLKCSMRTSHKNLDLSRLASLLGGGGHAKAAGFTIHGKIVKINSEWKVV